MDQLKVIRTVCLFTAHPSEHTLAQLEHLCRALAARGFVIQTHRLCSPDRNGVFALDRRTATPVLFSLGSQTFDSAQEFLAEFVAANNVHCNVDLTREQIDHRHVSLLTTLMRERPSKTFNFAYTFNPVASTPYFPSATYATDGFAIGLQPTDLSDGCQTLQAWLDRLKAVWTELDSMCSAEAGFLGIDPSIAPLGAGRGSFLHFLKRLGQDFSRSVTTDVYLRITRFLTEAAPKKVGLCGIMFACLEDFELAAEYEQGQFPIERAVFVSLHSGLGIDTYPLGVDERPERIAEVLRLVQGLSHKYHKPLSVRLVSDGNAKVGDLTHFGNAYLKDVVVRSL